MGALTLFGIIFLILAVAAVAAGLYLLLGKHDDIELLESRSAEKPSRWELDPASVRPERTQSTEFTPYSSSDLSEFTAEPDVTETAEEWFQQGCAHLRDGEESLAAACFAKASDMDHAKAQTMYGIQCLRGRGVAQNYEKGRRLLEKAARQGNIDAIYNLGVCYMYGRGVAQDNVSARKLLVYARSRGITEAGRLVEAIDSGVETEPLF